MAAYTIHKIQSLEIPELSPYRTLRRPREHLEQGIFVAEGHNVVRRFLESHWKVISLLMTQERFDAIIPSVPDQRLEGVEVFLADKAVLATIVGFALHQGIMAVGKVPAERSVSETVASLPSPHFLAALDGLVHAENVGTIVRNCAGFGIDGVIVSRSSASPYLRRAVRNSMGGVFKLPCVHVDDLAVALGHLQQESKTRIIIADAHAEMTIREADFSGNICLVFGNEDEGASQEVEAIANSRVCIPMSSGIDSLNVASASAVMLFAAREQR